MIINDVIMIHVIMVDIFFKLIEFCVYKIMYGKMFFFSRYKYELCNVCINLVILISLLSYKIHIGIINYEKIKGQLWEEISHDNTCPFNKVLVFFKIHRSVVRTNVLQMSNTKKIYENFKKDPV